VTLTFQLVRGKGFSSRLIGWFGSGFYSHIDVITPAGELRGARSDVIKGIPAGCQDRPQDYETWARQTRYTIDVTRSQWLRYWEFSDAQLGKPYDSRGLIESFVLGRQWRDDDSWWCSEWIGANLEYPRIVKIPPEVKSVEPGDCAFIFAGLRARRVEMIAYAS
jgi:hypothetical protein